ncbi:Translation initiation factor eIF-2B subunit delta [Orchesella cincta]|uniref:Translation initiation factor eIF2B subunit delta n=1 Tax=Orchesella cincta TaxID=48709 RepID=A0A1D2M329_ORCCI|nr:Translation initiation factor eIF-2B subunit delta [Orchesella cincta]
MDCKEDSKSNSGGPPAEDKSRDDVRAQRKPNGWQKQPGRAKPKKESVLQLSTTPNRLPEQISCCSAEASPPLHPLFHSIAIKISNNVIRGANSRCVKLLGAIKDFVQSYELPPGTSWKHSLSADLKASMDLLKTQCPFAISMSNSLDFVLSSLHNMNEGEDRSVNDLKGDLLKMIDQYVEEKVEKAVEAIVIYGLEKIAPGDKIMVYSITEAVIALLLKAAENGIHFELIVIQTPESMEEISELLNKLKNPILNKVIEVNSVNFSNALYRMVHCTKLLLGGHGLFTNGGVLAQAGSGQLALLAATYNKPALFLCETFKFCDRSPLDLFSLDEFISGAMWNQNQPENSKNDEEPFEPKIMFDVTPSTLVTVVITDIDMLPSNSVPVVLRVQEGRSLVKNAS